MTTPDRKQVTVNGIAWTIVSANERICTNAGRHFFALRCNSGKPWAIVEMDRDLLCGSAREIGYLPHRLTTQHLSLAVLSITSRREVLPVRSMHTPLTGLTKPAGAEYLKRIGAELSKCPFCEGWTPTQAKHIQCVHCTAIFDAKDASA